MVVLPDAMIECKTDEMILILFTNVEVASKCTRFRVVDRSSDAHAHIEVLASKRPRLLKEPKLRDVLRLDDQNLQATIRRRQTKSKLTRNRLS